MFPAPGKKSGGRSSPSVLLAFDWYDERIYRGIVSFAATAGWHLSPYLLSDRYLPHNWRGDGAITCYGENLAAFIKSLRMPMVDVSMTTDLKGYRARSIASTTEKTHGNSENANFAEPEHASLILKTAEGLAAD